MNAAEIEKALKDLETTGQCIKRHPTRQVWRFAAGGKPFIVKFYPHRPNRWRKLVRGSLAMHEFTRLQWLQKAGVSSPRAVAVLMGFSIGGEKGDAVVLEAIEPAERLDELVTRCRLEGRDIPDHRGIARQIVTIVEQLGRAQLGHSDLHMGNFLVRQGTVCLIDAYPLHRKGVTVRDMLKLGLSVHGVATRTDLLRAWRQLAGSDFLPPRNRQWAKHLRKMQSRIMGENQYFGRLADGPWRGVCFRYAKHPRRWAPISQMSVQTEHWQREWPNLLKRIEADQFDILKRSPSGDVLSGQAVLGGRPVDVIIKRPRRKKWVRFLSEIGRGSRARRAWRKSWSLVHRDLPTAWPLLLMEKRVLGYVTDAVIVYERLAGEPLSQVNLDELPARDRQGLFHRTGRLLRLLEQSGLYHWDAKSSNWMIVPDAVTGPYPVMVDVDGIRSNWGIGEGMRRLLLAMKQHPQYTPEDSFHLCKGYGPFAQMIRREDEVEDGNAEGNEE